MDKYLRVCLTESEVDERMTKWHPHVEDYYVESDGGCDLGITFRDITGRDYGESTLAETLYEALRSRNMKLATAESLTGGMIAAAIVDVPGASEVFYGGIVAYTEAAKIEKLGVLDSTLGECGAVSGETAVEMATGMLSDMVSVAVSATGLAGPGGGSALKPVGLTYIAVADDEHTEVYEHRFYGDRDEIRRQARDYALFYVIRHLEEYFRL